MILTGVIGWPVAHSRSPQMQNAAFRAAALDWRYLKLPVRSELLEETVRALPVSGYRGANVTIPHKEAALALADQSSDAAREIRAANTLVFEEGRIMADNTDAGGFLAALGEPPSGLRALVLGAGGAGRAVAWALRESGAAEVLVWNRTPARAAALAEDLDVRHAERPEPVDLLVNATAVGLSPGDGIEALGLDWLEPPRIVVDLVYADEPTPVAAWAKRGGSRVIDGLEVLVRQGALSFELWTGRKAPLEAMRVAARARSVLDTAPRR